MKKTISLLLCLALLGLAGCGTGSTASTPAPTQAAETAPAENSFTST